MSVFIALFDGPIWEGPYPQRRLIQGVQKVSVRKDKKFASSGRKRILSLLA